MALIGVIGSGVAETEELVQEALADLRDKAAKHKEKLKALVAVEKEPSDSIGVVLQWLLDEEIPYDIVVHPDVADELGVFSEGAKVTKTKTPTTKAVDLLVKGEGQALLVLLPEEGEETNEEQACVAKAIESSIDVFNLTKGLVDEGGMEEVAFGGDAPDDDNAEPTLEEIGAVADDDEDDDHEQARDVLNERGEAVGLNEENYKTWAEFAAAIGEAEEAGESADRAAAKDEDDAPSKWTAEKVKAITELSELRDIVAKSGAGADAKKWPRPKLTEYLLGLGGDEPEEEPEKPAKTTKATTGKQGPGTGKTVIDTTIAGRIDDACKVIVSGLQALVNALVDAKK